MKNSSRSPNLSQFSIGWSECFHILVNYDEPQAIAKALAAAKLNGQSIRLSPAAIPLFGSGQIEHQVRELHFGREIQNRDLPKTLKQRAQALGFKVGLKLADPLTALRYVGVYPEKQRQYPLAIVFTCQVTRLWFFYFSQHYSERFLYAGQCSPDSRWGADIRFLVV